MATTRTTTTNPAADPLAKPDGQFVMTEALRSDVAGYQESRYAQAYGELVSAESLRKLLESHDPPSLQDLSSMIQRHLSSLSTFGFGKETVRKAAHPDLRKLLPIWMAYRHEGVLDILIRYPDDPLLLKYTEQWVLRWPVFAVERILATGASSQSPLMSLVTRLLHEHPDWIEPLRARGSLPKWLDEALAKPGSLGDFARTSSTPGQPSAGGEPSATVDTDAVSDWPVDVPELLRHPPWQREKKPTAKEKLEQPWLKLPPKLPSLPTFWNPIGLSRPLLRESQQPLPPAAVQALLSMCLLSKPGAPYAGLEQVLPALDPASLASLGRDLLAQWEAAECPLEERWMLLAQAWLGDAHTLWTLSDAIACWPSEMAFPRAKFGLSVLADMAAFQRSDEPLRTLIRFAESGKPSLRKPAQDQVQKAAQRMGITADELADRVIPDLGLARPEDHVFDFGPRRFTLRFDDSLQPFVIDDSQRRHTELPKPNAKDNASLAPNAVQRWKALKKLARALANEQIARLEVALASQRTWSTSAFTRLFTQHPLMRELGRRLLWSTTGAHRPARRFRVSEEHTLLDIHDAPVALDEGESVCLAHPIDLEAGELATWTQLWADYELLQPFEQLARRVYRLDNEGADAPLDVPSARGQAVAAGSLLGLVQRGWTRMQDGYQVLGLRYTTPHGGAATLHLQNPMDVSAPLLVPVLTIRELSLDAALTPLDRSEVLRAIDRLARS